MRSKVVDAWTVRGPEAVIVWGPTAPDALVGMEAEHAKLPFAVDVTRQSNTVRPGASR